MMISGRITLRATILVLACSVGAALVCSSNAHSQDHPVGQGRPKTDARNSGHKYTRFSGWISCGVRYRGYDGRVGQEGEALNCDDGAIVYDVKVGFTSDRAAEAERRARLEGKAPSRNPWRIARTEPLGDAMVVEFAEPVSVRTNQEASNHWVIMWARDKALFSIYGPDREHVINYYQTRYGGEAKK